MYEIIKPAIPAIVITVILYSIGIIYLVIVLLNLVL